VTAVVGTATYDNLRFDVYSETGTRFSTRVEAAAEGLGSDYDYSRSFAAYFRSLPLGDTPHQTLHFLAQGGLVTDGPRSRNNFSLGGSGRLRGYESDFVEGDRFYYGAIEYLRPIRWNWLRLFATAEIGGADDDIRGETDGRPYASLGLGVRLRLTWFVDVELEAGIAMPLRDGDGPRFFAGGN
jgi:outer membrane protein assembly factor BamA